MPAGRSLVLQALGVAAPGAPQWSPDGRRLAYAVAAPDFDRNRYETSIWVLNLEDERHWALASGLVGQNVPLAWSPDGSHLAYLAKGEEGYELQIAELATGQSHRLPAPEGSHGQIAAFEFFVTLAWSPDGTRLLYAAQDLPPETPPDPVVNPRNDGDGYGEIQRIRLWVVRLDGAGSPLAISSPDFHSGAGCWSPDGAGILFVSNRSGQEEGAQGGLNQAFDLWTVPAAGGLERRLTEGPGANLRPIWSPDGRHVAFTGAPRYGSHADVLDLQVIRADGSRRQTLTAGLDRSVDPLSAQSWASADGLLVTVATGATNTAYRVSRAGVHQPVPGDRCYVTGGAARPGGDGIAWVAQGPTEPPEIQFVDWSGRPRWQSDHNAAVRPAGRVASRSITTADGTDVEIVLGTPADGQAPRTAILYPHGGPHSRSTLDYRPDWQALLSHGYGLIAPNFRGSGGYGQAFIDADNRDLGGADFADCLASLDAQIEAGEIDPERCFIAGSSYGGFLTVWAIGHTDRFRAALAINAVVNLPSFFGQTDIPSWIRWEFGGTRVEVGAALRARSPIEHLSGATTPMLVVHSEDDRRVPIAQGLELHAVLRALGVATEFVRYPREPHRIAEPLHRVDLIERSINWFEMHDRAAQT